MTGSLQFGLNDWPSRQGTWAVGECRTIWLNLLVLALGWNAFYPHSLCAGEEFPFRIPAIEAAPADPPVQTKKSSKQKGQQNARKPVVTAVWQEDSTPDSANPEPKPIPKKNPPSLNIEGPASDPEWPTWTATDDPAKQPMVRMIDEYTLIRPPFGVAPDEEGQEYQRYVASEDDLDFNEATLPMPIDIFRPDGVAPSGVIGDHTLNTLGRIMVSYRFNDIAFSGLRNGSHSVSTASALSQFPIVPTNGTAQNQLFILEYGVTDDLTIMGVLPIIQRHFNYIDASGNPYVNSITDLSDIQLSALYVLARTENQQLHLNLGMQVPTGIFIEQGSTTSPTSPALTYPVRSSDGTWDFMPGFTYRGQSRDWTWGLQAIGTFRFGINKYDYRLGNEGNFNAWLARKLTESTSVSVRLNGHIMGNIYGADPQLNPALTPSNNPMLQAYQQFNILFGVNYVVPDGLLRGQRIGVEGGLPLYQWLDGPELGTKYQLWANLTLLF